jgi:hypothetical protein
MHKIINEVKEGGVQFIDHIASFLCVIVTNIQGIHLSKVNEIMHPNMVFHYMNCDIGNSMHWMKDWHKTKLKHGNIYKKRAHEFQKTTQTCLYLSPILIFHY